MNAWKEYKEKLGTTRPWDMVRKNIEYVDDATADSRLNICEECPRLIRATHQCKECGCFMKLKTKLKPATCPLGKW